MAALASILILARGSSCVLCQLLCSAGLMHRKACLTFVPALSCSDVSEWLARTSCHQRHLPSEPPGLSWSVALVQDRSLGHPLGDAPNAAGDVRLPGLGLTALQLKGFGVTPPEHPLQHDFCHHMHRDSWVGLVFVLQLVPSQQGGAGGWGRSQAVTPLILKVVSRDF